MNHIYEFLKEITLMTPVWVWIILIYFIFLGIKLCCSHLVYLPKLTLITLLSLVLNYFFLFPSTNFHLLIYCLAMSGGVGLGMWTTYKTPLKIFKDKACLEVSGSYFL